MGGYKVITKDQRHYGLTHQEVKLKECLYRALREDYRIIYPDHTAINVQFEG